MDSRLGLRLLITEFMKEVSPLLPNPCHFQDYGRSMFPRARHDEDGSPALELEACEPDFSLRQSKSPSIHHKTVTRLHERVHMVKLYPEL